MEITPAKEFATWTVNEVKKHDKLINYIESTGILIAKHEHVIKNDDE